MRTRGQEEAVADPQPESVGRSFPAHAGAGKLIGPGTGDSGEATTSGAEFRRWSELALTMLEVFYRRRSELRRVGWRCLEASTLYGSYLAGGSQADRRR